MSSTQGHTNIHTVHTTVDISVLLGEINRIADESYSEGFESGYDVGMKAGRADQKKEDNEFFNFENAWELEKQKIRADAIEEYKNRLWEDVETRYKNDIKILGYLSAENLLRDVHNAICYFAEQLKEQMQKGERNESRNRI